VSTAEYSADSIGELVGTELPLRLRHYADPLAASFDTAVVGLGERRATAHVAQGGAGYPPGR